MLIKNFVNFTWIDVFTTSNDHVALTVNDEKEPINVAIANISRMKPAVPKRFRSRAVVLVITFQDVFTAQHYFAQLTIRYIPVFLVNHLHFISDRQSAGTRTASFVRRVKCRSTRRLRKSIAFNHEAVERLFKTLHHFSGHWRRSTHRKT